MATNLDLWAGWAGATLFGNVIAWLNIDRKL